MKETTNFMRRYELKFTLNKSQLEFFVNRINDYMEVDKYGLTSIASIYFDTPNYSLINRSIEKPEYKEKIRLRSYGLASKDSTLYLEIKRKLNGIVYKRRIPVKEDEAFNLIYLKGTGKDGQVDKEVEEFIKKYPLLRPQYLVIYDRVAYYQKDSDIRITIDKNPRYRTNYLNLHTSMEGTSLLEEDNAILEIKVQNALPLWLVAILSEGKIYQSSFSKVGKAHMLENIIHQPGVVMEDNDIYIKEGGKYHYGLAI